MKQSSLVHDVLSARYYKNYYFLNARRGFDPSFVWHSISVARALLLDGLKWRAGDGTQIGVWEYSWLLGESTSLVPTPNLECPTDLRVSDLLDANGGRSAETLNEHLMLEDARLVREISLSERRLKVVLFWWSACIV